MMKRKNFRLSHGIIRQFLGITRLARWERAQEHDLEPPTEVREILEKHENDPKFTEWFVL